MSTYFSTRTRWIGAALLMVTIAGCGGGSTNLPSPPAGVTPQASTAEMVFIGQRNGQNALFTANLDGSNLSYIPTAAGTRPFTNFSTYPPAWSSKGQHIVYTNFLDGGRGGISTNIRRVNADGTGDRELIPANTQDAVPSPDGRRVLYYSTQFNPGVTPGIFVADADGANRRRLSDGAQASWSPDGNSIVYVEASTVEVPEVGVAFSAPDIFTMNSDGSSKKRLTSALGGETEPHFSPDGSHIVYVSDDTTYDLNSGFNNNPAIYTMNADGSNQKRLAPAFPLSSIQNPRWTRDGRRIAFLRITETGGLFTVNADGTGETRLQDNFDATGVQGFDLR